MPKVSNARDVKSVNGVNLLVMSYNTAFQGNKRGEVVVHAATTANGSWAEVHRFMGTMAEGVAYAKAANVVVTGERQAHVA